MTDERKAKPAVTQPAADDAFLIGMTDTACCRDCNESGCVITGDVCGHPYKGGLHAKHQMQKDVVDRYARAKNFLKHQAVDKQRSA